MYAYTNILSHATPPLPDSTTSDQIPLRQPATSNGRRATNLSQATIFLSALSTSIEHQASSNFQSKSQGSDKKNPKIAKNLLNPSTHYPIITYPFSAFSFFLGGELFFNPNAHVHPIYGMNYIPMLYEIKFNGDSKSILRIDTERTCGELVESSRMYENKNLSAAPFGGLTAAKPFGETGSIKNNKLCKTNPISEKPKMV
jgi:hypothetical protein